MTHDTEVIITFKVSPQKLEEYNRHWLAGGFKNRSEFLRQAADAAMSPRKKGAANISAQLIQEYNVHLHRIAVTLSELLTKSVANDNQIEQADFVDKLSRSLQKIEKLRI